MFTEEGRYKESIISIIKNKLIDLDMINELIDKLYNKK